MYTEINPRINPIEISNLISSTHKKTDDSRWETVARTTNGPIQEFTVSFQSLLPSTAYKFRVIAYNRYGISCPVYSDDAILTPSKLYLEYGYLQQKPFYRQTWFMVALAATSIIIIIMVIAVLCVKSKSYKYKREYFAKIAKKSSKLTRFSQRFHRGSPKDPGGIDGDVDRRAARAGAGTVPIAARRHEPERNVERDEHAGQEDGNDPGGKQKAADVGGGGRFAGEESAAAIAGVGGVPQR